MFFSYPQKLSTQTIWFAHSQSTKKYLPQSISFPEISFSHSSLSEITTHKQNEGRKWAFPPASITVRYQYAHNNEGKKNKNIIK